MTLIVLGVIFFAETAGQKTSSFPRKVCDDIKRKSSTKGSEKMVNAHFRNPLRQLIDPLNFNTAT